MNLVTTDDSNLCKNNYYYALTSESVPIPPPNILPSHTGIADSGATDFYFTPNAPVTNYNPQALPVGVRVANGQPERSVASATLASVPSLPRAAMTGHVMPSFPHTLIGLGPFADLGCKIVFTKTAVTFYHLDGHPILAGWRDETGPRLWHFPLTAEAAQIALNDVSPQVPIPLTAEAAYVAVDTASHPPQLSIPPRTPRKRKWTRIRTRARQAAGKQRRHASPRQRITFTLPPHHVDKDSTFWRRIQPEERTTYRIDPRTAVMHSPTITPLHPHPSQGILATSTAGAACSVYYLYGAAQAVALAARAAGTPFDPRSLDLPSIGALVGFYHAVLAFQSNKPG